MSAAVGLLAGRGSAGSVLCTRLSLDGSHQILQQPHSAAVLIVTAILALSSGYQLSLCVDVSVAPSPCLTVAVSQSFSLLYT